MTIAFELYNISILEINATCAKETTISAGNCDSVVINCHYCLNMSIDVTKSLNLSVVRSGLDYNYYVWNKLYVLDTVQTHIVLPNLHYSGMCEHTPY